MSLNNYSGSLKSLTALILCCVSLNAVAQNAPLKGVATCQFDMTNDTNYCSKTNQAKYRKALATQKPNFNQHYILLEVEPTHYAAIDTQTGVVYPLWHELLDHQDTGKKAKIQFSLEQPELCFWGLAYAYQDVIETDQWGEGAQKGKKPVCFSIYPDEYSPKYQYQFRRNWNTP